MRGNYRNRRGFDGPIENGEVYAEVMSQQNSGPVNGT